VNLISFLVLLAVGVSLTVSTVISFVLAAAANYFLCMALLFRHKARWNSVGEVAMYAVVVMAMGAFDLGATSVCTPWEWRPGWQSLSRQFSASFSISWGESM